MCIVWADGWKRSNLKVVDFAAEFLRETVAFGELIAAADPDAPVPTCPEWNVTQLFRHVGGGNRWAAQIVIDRAEGPIDPREVPGARAPKGMAAALDWLRAGAVTLTQPAAEAGETPVWTFTGPKPASWWVRRRLHETVVHRADAAIAAGAPFVIDPAVAADCISELFDLAITRIPDLGGRSVHLHATDDGLGAAGEWTLRNGSWEQAHGKGDVALRGPARDLLLVVARRAPVADTAVEVFGDHALLSTLVAGMAF